MSRMITPIRSSITPENASLRMRIRSQLPMKRKLEMQMKKYGVKKAKLFHRHADWISLFGFWIIFLISVRWIKRGRLFFQDFSYSLECAHFYIPAFKNTISHEYRFYLPILNIYLILDFGADNFFWPEHAPQVTHGNLRKNSLTFFHNLYVRSQNPVGFI